MVLQQGMNFLSGVWCQDTYDSLDASLSLSNLIETNTNYLALSFTWSQWTVDTPGPIYSTDVTPTDAEIESIISLAHSKGVRVMVRPLVDPDWTNPNTAGTWRGEIGRNFTESDWDSWFQSYNSMLTHYAAMSQQWRADEFCVGGELIIASHQTDRWIDTVKQVRALYDGPLLYAANHGNEDSIEWYT
jgi:hypothetical protein